jgi:ATP-binding cassette subfamily F protein 3
MDEPTTHLDMPSIDALLGALKQFDGTLIFISHDVYFIRSLAGHVVHVNAGRLTHYSGDYQYYLDKTSATSARAALTAGDSPVEAAREKPVERIAAKSKEQKRAEAEQRQGRSRVRREQQQLMAGLEKEISELEKKQVELTAELEKPETYSQPGRAMEINRELIYVQDRLGAITPDWEAAALNLENMESA